MVTYLDNTSQRARKMNKIDGGKFSLVMEAYRSLCEIFSAPLSIRKVKGRMARRMLEKIAINAEDEQGRTLLILACLDNKEDIVRFLLESYSEVISFDQCDKKGNTALHYACLGGRKSLIAKLITAMINRGVNIKRANQEGLTAVDLALRNGNFHVAEIIIKELYANRLDSTFLEDPVCRCNYTVPNLFITDKHHSLDNQSLECNPAQGIAFPSILRAKSHGSFKEVGGYSPTVVPKFDARKSSKAMCSHLLTLRSMQETAAYRQGFPLVNSHKKGDPIRIKPFSSRYRTLSPIPSQTGVRSRRGSTYMGSIAINIKPEESTCSTDKTLYARRSQNATKMK